MVLGDLRFCKHVIIHYQSSFIVGPQLYPDYDHSSYCDAVCSPVPCLMFTSPENTLDLLTVTVNLKKA